MTDLNVIVTVREGGRSLTSTLRIAAERISSTTVRELVVQVLLEHGIQQPPESCRVTCHGRELTPDSTLNPSWSPWWNYPDPARRNQLVLTIECPTDGSLPTTKLEPAPAGLPLGGPPPAPCTAPPPAPCAPAAAEGDKDLFETTDFNVPALGEESGSQVVNLDEEDAGASLDEEPAAAPPPKRKTKARAAVADQEEEGGLDLEFDARLAGDEEEEAPLARARASATPRKAARVVQRHATVRYYSRMNPGRIYPLMVTLTRKALQRLERADIGQESRNVPVKIGAAIEIEPVLPGCDCYPPRQTVEVGHDDIKAEFHVVPRMVGHVPLAKVVLREGAQKVTELPLEINVSNPLLVTLTGLTALCLPFLSATMKHFRMDFESQLQDGFDAYLVVARWALASLRPEVLAGILVGLTALVWLFLRPRQRDAFWDIDEKGGEALPQDSRLGRVARHGLSCAARYCLAGALTGLLLGGGVLAAVAYGVAPERAQALAPVMLLGMLGAGAAGGVVLGVLAGVTEGWEA